MKNKNGVYAGTFDILTNGHWWMIEQGVMLFDHLHVAIGMNPTKKNNYFSAEERLECLESALQVFGLLNKAVSVGVYSNSYLVDYARSVNANYLLRGLRSEADFDYERVMRNVNGDLDKGINTVFLMPPREIAEVSSSLVKGLIGPAGWENVIVKYVPTAVFTRIMKKENNARPDS